MNNTPDYENNLFFEKKMTDCKNCPYTDEYCASGDCERDNDLTEQWIKGELPCGWYYVEGNRAEGIYAYTAEYLNNMYRPRNGERIIEQVPSYEEWKELIESEEKSHLQADSYYNKILELKDLLKECKQWFDWYHIDTEIGKEYIESWHKKGHEIHKKINEVLK